MPVSLLDSVENLKGQFGKQAEEEAALVLAEIGGGHFSSPVDLIRLHETLLFLRAYPQSARVMQRVDRLLLTFGPRLRGIPREEFEYAEVSGIVRTQVSTTFSHSFALSLAQRHGRRIGIDWARYTTPERMGRTLAKLIPEAFEDWAIEPHADWQRWYQKAGGDLLWLLRNVDPEIYDLLEIPLRWEIGDSAGSRTRLRIPRSRIFYHHGPLLARKDVSIEAELTSARIAVSKLSHKRAETMIGVMIDASATRYRELYGFEYPDTGAVFHADLGRGVDFYFCGVKREWKLPKREYLAGMYFKNGVPTGYVEVMWPRSGEKNRMEVGFNLYYTFRQGETAWLYARLLKLFHEHCEVTSFLIDPYQIGHDNAEAIESGAFWFYYKLGFRPLNRTAANLAASEFRKIQAHPGHRTSVARLTQLAKESLVYSIRT